MIKRFVKLTLDIEKMDHFMAVLDQNIDKIRASQGCSHLEILSDIHAPGSVWTFSLWDTEEDLNNYRNSTLFKGVWSEFKKCFSGKPEAWSTQTIRRKA